MYRNISRTLAARAKQQMSHATRNAPQRVHRCFESLPRLTRNALISATLKDATIGIPFFNKLDSDCRARILEHLRPCRFKAGEPIRTPPLPRTNRTRRVPHPVLIGHAASLSQAGEPIFQALDVGTEMYFVSAGEVQHLGFDG